MTNSDQVNHENDSTVVDRKTEQGFNSTSKAPERIALHPTTLQTMQGYIYTAEDKEAGDVEYVRADLLDSLVAALASVTRELDEIVNVTSRAIEQCKGNFASRVGSSLKAIEEARAALALADKK